MLPRLIGRRFATSVVMPSIGQLRVQQRNIATTANLQKIFTVQSVEDFEERVRKSKTPIVVDFFATYVNKKKQQKIIYTN